MLLERGQAGDADALCRLGYRYAYGRRKRDYKRAADLWEKAASKGHVRAALFLGIAYDLGRGRKKDLKRAVEFYRRAARGGHSTAQYNLAKCYEMGEGVPYDPVSAFRWMKRAGDQCDDPDAMSDVGYYYHEGIGTRKDSSVAIQWYRAAAKMGSSRAQLNLGLSYNAGDGTRRNLALAIKWLEAAAAQGNNTAKRVRKMIRQETGR